MRDPAASHRGDPDDPRDRWRDESSAHHQAGEPSTGGPRLGDTQSRERDRGANPDVEHGVESPDPDGHAATDGSAADDHGAPVGSSDVPTPPNAAASTTGDTNAATTAAVPTRRRPERAPTSPRDENDATPSRPDPNASARPSDVEAAKDGAATDGAAKDGAAGSGGLDAGVSDSVGSGAKASRSARTRRATADSSAIDSLLVDDGAMLASDLKTKVAEAWHDFARALARAIADLPSGAHLDVTLDPAATGSGATIYEVSVQHNPDGHLGALAVGNATLPEGSRLSRDAIAEMIVIGWSPPGVVAGSEKDFGLAVPGSDAARVAVIVTKTLRDVYGSPHPAFLRYAAHDSDENPITIEPLAAARVSTGDAKLDSLRLSPEGFALLQDPSMSLLERVRIVVAGLQRTDPESLQVDKDGDIGIRSGSAMVFVRVRDNPPLVDVFSPILTDVEPSEKLYAKLSDLTTKMPIGRLYQANKTVWASVPVFGRDFQATHLMLAVQVMTGLADELDDRLHGEFGGRRFFGEGDTPVATPDSSEANTGMYL